MWVQNCMLIESLFNKILNVKQASDAKACFPSNVEYCAVIRYLYLKGNTGREIHDELANVYSSSAPSHAEVKFWIGEFNCGRTSLEDEVRSGHPLDPPTKK